MAIDKEKIRRAVRAILEAIGEDPDREGLRDTPRRVAEMYEEVCAGLHRDPADDLEVYFTEDHEEMVLVRDIPFYSLCEHHLVPFYGRAHVAYLPRRGFLTGLSKLARVVETVARRPQLQERMTSAIADLVMSRLHAHGVLVIVEAEHMCMSMRGVKKPGAETVTSAVRGEFATNTATRMEALSLIRGRARH